VRSIRSRNAARPLPADDTEHGEVEGFTFVETVIGLLVAGIFVAIVVFSVFTVTHPVPKPDPACTSEVKDVQDALAQFWLTHKGTYPKTLEELVKAQLLDAAPTKTSPAGAAGFIYKPATGDYVGTCPKH
jgi:hypothetical protein